MKEELTREVLEAMRQCQNYEECGECPADGICPGIYEAVPKLATALLEEMDKPKVWDGAPEWAEGACIIWDDGEGQKYTRLYNSERFNRELPKTRARQIAEEVTALVNRAIEGISVEEVEAVLNKYAAELKGKE